MQYFPLFYVSLNMEGVLGTPQMPLIHTDEVFRIYRCENPYDLQ